MTMMMMIGTHTHTKIGKDKLTPIERYSHATATRTPKTSFRQAINASGIHFHFKFGESQHIVKVEQFVLGRTIQIGAYGTQSISMEPVRRDTFVWGGGRLISFMPVVVIRCTMSYDVLKDTVLKDNGKHKTANTVITQA